MGGELAFKVEKIFSDKYFVRPSEYSISLFNNEGTPSNDLSIKIQNGGYLHICGDNDWAYLALEILEPIKQEAIKLLEIITKRKSENPSIKAIMLGKNDKRIMDVYFGGKDKRERIFGIPVMTTDKFNEITFLIEDTDVVLPFF